MTRFFSMYINITLYFVLLYLNVGIIILIITKRSKYVGKSNEFGFSFLHLYGRGEFTTKMHFDSRP